MVYDRLGGGPEYHKVNELIREPVTACKERTPPGLYQNTVDRGSEVNVLISYPISGRFMDHQGRK
jgi:hypothetical protein